MLSDRGPTPDQKEPAMPQGSTTFHEAEERLSPRTRDMHRALVSLMEELEAIDWYQQRMDATEDAELRDILRHNREEEVEHASMVLEWIRRRDTDFSAKLKTYLFTEGAIVGIEDAAESGRANGRPGASAPRSIGSLRGGQ
jgi:ferritin-like protein